MLLKLNKFLYIRLAFGFLLPAQTLCALSSVSAVRSTVTLPRTVSIKVVKPKNLMVTQKVGPRNESCRYRVAKPNIVPRTKWFRASKSVKAGLKTPVTCGLNKEILGPPRAIILHHAGINNPKKQSVLRRVVAFYQHHTQKKGWKNIAYHFIIGQAGEIVEGYGGFNLDAPKLIPMGSHAKGYNGGPKGVSIGICLDGNYNTNLPPKPQLDALVHLLAYLCERCHINPTGRVVWPNSGRRVVIPCITGHGQLPGVKTNCPGYALQKLLLPDVKDTAPKPKTGDLNRVFPPLQTAVAQFMKRY
ncbi:MAG: hypothetical protein RLZ12_1036 [Bacillota bacterium]